MDLTIQTPWLVTFLGGMLVGGGQGEGLWGGAAGSAVGTASPCAADTHSCWF